MRHMADRKQKPWCARSVAYVHHVQRQRSRMNYERRHSLSESKHHKPTLYHSRRPDLHCHLYHGSYTKKQTKIKATHTRTE